MDVDDEGRIRTDALAAALDDVPPGSPVVVCLQAGNIHSGAFDPFAAAAAVAHGRGAWVHVDGAFGLWAGASPSLRHLVAGVADADSWATDAHKTLNVPYDCGLAVVADPTALRTAMGMRSSYLVADDTGPGDPHDKVPELSRRARGVPVWAVLRALGRRGVADLVDRLAAGARDLAEGIGRVEGARSSTTSSSPRCAWPSRTTTAPARSSRVFSRAAGRGCQGRAGTTGTCSGCR